MRPRFYLAGEHAAMIAALFDDTQADARVVDRRVGSASARKMAYGGFQKASRALAAVSHALAREFDVQDELTAEGLSMQTAVLGHPHQLSSAAARGWRWAPEMEEVATTLTGLGLPADLARGAAAVMRRWERDKDDVGISVDEVLNHRRATAAHHSSRSARTSLTLRGQRRSTSTRMPSSSVGSS